MHNVLLADLATIEAVVCAAVAKQSAPLCGPGPEVYSPRRCEVRAMYPWWLLEHELPCKLPTKCGKQPCASPCLWGCPAQRDPLQIFVFRCSATPPAAFPGIEWLVYAVCLLPSVCFLCHAQGGHKSWRCLCHEGFCWLEAARITGMSEEERMQKCTNMSLDPKQFTAGQPRATMTRS
jgi:hypothetical protein